ncbi:hypothetical protein [Glycomyces tarimensis]
MRQKGSDQVGRWPWGVWFALVGVSTGTVASFAAVGWAFLSATGLHGGVDTAAPPDRGQGEIVIEAELTADPESSPEGTEPTTEAESVPVPQLERVRVEAETEAAPEPEPEPRPHPVEPEPELATESEDPKLVPAEEDWNCDRPQLRPSDDGEEDSDEDDERSDTGAPLNPIVEQEPGSSPRPKG